MTPRHGRFNSLQLRSSALRCCKNDLCAPNLNVCLSKRQRLSFGKLTTHNGFSRFCKKFSIPSFFPQTNNAASAVRSSGLIPKRVEICGRFNGKSHRRPIEEKNIRTAKSCQRPITEGLRGTTFLFLSLLGTPVRLPKPPTISVKHHNTRSAFLKGHTLLFLFCLAAINYTGFLTSPYSWISFFFLQGHRV